RGTACPHSYGALKCRSTTADSGHQLETRAGSPRRHRQPRTDRRGPVVLASFRSWPCPYRRRRTRRWPNTTATLCVPPWAGRPLRLRQRGIGTRTRDHRGGHRRAHWPDMRLIVNESVERGFQDTASRYTDRCRGHPMMGVLTQPIRKTSTSPSLLSQPLALRHSADATPSTSPAPANTSPGKGPSRNAGPTLPMTGADGVVATGSFAIPSSAVSPTNLSATDRPRFIFASAATNASSVAASGVKTPLLRRPHERRSLEPASTGRCVPSSSTTTPCP